MAKQPCTHTKSIEICRRCKKKLADLSDLMVVSFSEAEIRNLVTCLRFLQSFQQRAITLSGLLPASELLIQKLLAKTPPSDKRILCQKDGRTSDSTD